MDNMTIEGEFAQEGSPIEVNKKVAEQINRLARQRDVSIGTLVNEVLRRYVAEQPDTGQDHAAFLLDLAGMFDSGERDTSENVNEIVGEAIRQAYEQDVL